MKNTILTFCCILLQQSLFAENKDWLIDGSPYKTEVNLSSDKKQIELTNGLLRRSFSLTPNGATIALDNLMTGQNELRAVRPEAVLVINGKEYPVGGLEGQPVHNFLTKDFLSKIGLEGLVIGVMTMISFLTGYHQDGALLGSTYAFGTLCLARLFHGYNCKSDHPVIFTKRFFNNKWMQGAFALGAILITAVLKIPGLHQVFKVETLNFEQLGTVYLYAFACFPIIQLLKWVRGKLSE